jgi:mono/diheme cytochrome c family protein/glucose/arabinose dehydrogenase
MRLTLPRIFLASIAAIGTAGQAPIPPARAAASETPVLSPADEMKTFRLPPGYRVELVASEPMVEEPVAIDWDQEGRLWVVEMLGYMQDLPGTTERDPIGRVSVLADQDGDGRMDKKTVFMDGLVLPRAIKVLDRGVLIGEPPNLWLARDTNGDLRADTKELVTNTFGRADANVEHNANTLLWALDNWIHTAETDVYLRERQGKFETRKTLSRGQWGASQDDGGRIFRNTNESVLHVDLVPTPYYARNPNLVRTRGSYESLRGPKNEVNVVWPSHPTPGVNRGYQRGVLRADGTLATYTSVSAPTVYRGDRLPAELYGNVFVVEPAGNLVSRIIISDDGTTLRARKAYEQGEFLTSTDERFRPVNLASAPDGTLYVVDIYRGIIQHRGYITEYLHQQIVSRKLDAPPRHGRIYRIVHETTKRAPKPALTNLPAPRLVDLLSHRNGWYRDAAQRMLVERRAVAVVPALKRLAVQAPDPRARLHALWTIDGLDATDPALVVRAAEDSSRDVRVAAIRLAEPWLADPASAPHARVLKLVDDPDWAVRRQLAASLGLLPPGQRETVLTSMITRFGGDPIVVDAALSGVRGSEPQLLARLMASPAETPAIAAGITMTGAAIVRSADESAVQNLMQTIATDSTPAWQRSALLRGAEVTLLAAAMPGGSGGGRGTNPTPPDTRPGSRAGPGGAPAFPRTEAATPRTANVRALKLGREPALTALASQTTGELSSRAAAVLERIVWPGKPAAAVAALTAEEQRRFEAGREVYQSLCSACHQPDGAGRENVAPSLIGSEFALAAAAIPVRIVLNGKEGSVGLMPPLGSVLSDEQVAAALTYIRREWGHTAGAVAPSTVGEVRAATKDRTRPWNTDELSKLQTNR